VEGLPAETANQRQGLLREGRHLPAGLPEAVQGIADDRMSDVGKVDSDLMGPPGTQGGSRGFSASMVGVGRQGGLTFLSEMLVTPCQRSCSRGMAIG